MWLRRGKESLPTSILSTQDEKVWNTYLLGKRRSSATFSRLNKTGEGTRAVFQPSGYLVTYQCTRGPSRFPTICHIFPFCLLPPPEGKHTERSLRNLRNSDVFYNWWSLQRKHRAERSTALALLRVPPYRPPGVQAQKLPLTCRPLLLHHHERTALRAAKSTAGHSPLLGVKHSICQNAIHPPLSKSPWGSDTVCVNRMSP